MLTTTQLQFSQDNKRACVFFGVGACWKKIDSPSSSSHIVATTAKHEINTPVYTLPTIQQRVTFTQGSSRYRSATFCQGPASTVRSHCRRLHHNEAILLRNYQCHHCPSPQQHNMQANSALCSYLVTSAKLLLRISQSICCDDDIHLTHLTQPDFLLKPISMGVRKCLEALI